MKARRIQVQETDLNGDNVCLCCRLALAVDGKNYCRECIEKSTPRLTGGKTTPRWNQADVRDVEPDSSQERDA